MRGVNDLLFVQSDKTKQWRWRLRSGTNGKIIGASSESFKTLRHCVENFALVRNREFLYSITYARGARIVSKLPIGKILGRAK